MIISNILQLIFIPLSACIKTNSRPKINTVSINIQGSCECLVQHMFAQKISYHEIKFKITKSSEL